MLGADAEIVFDRLDDELRLAPALAPQLFRKVVDCLGGRLASLRRSGRAFRIDRLIEAGAWIDAVFALIELETPGWQVRRLAYEDGEWLCSLSRQPNLPIALDEAAEAGHEALPLAVLRAFVQARRRSGAKPETASTVPRVRPTSDRMICCDNFA